MKNYLSKISNFLKSNKQKFVLPVFAVVCLNLFFALTLSLNSTPSTQTSNNLQTTTLSNTISLNLNEVNTNSGIDIMLKAVKNLNSTKNVTIKSNGKINAFVNQTLNILRMRNGENNFSQNITTGFKNIASRVYSNPKNVKSVKGNSIKANSAKWNGEEKNYTLSEYINKFSLSPNQLLPYNINETSIITAGNVVVLANGNYSFTVNLHPSLSTKDYGENIKELLKSNNAPTFNNVTLTVEIDNAFNFKTAKVNESYTIKILGFNKTCHAEITSTFDFKTKATIPSN